jgi:hypothetical protein
MGARLGLMVEELGPSTDQRAVDKEHLDVLSTLHYVGAGLALVGIGFLVMHYALFSSVMNPDVWKGQPAPPPAGFFDMFKWIYAVFGAWLGSSLLLNVLAGNYLRARKHRTFCFVVAGVNCLHTPLGTVLGIFTIVVLARDSVRLAFQSRTDVERLG